MGIFDWKHWVVLLAVVILVFGTKKLKNLGSDLGESIKGFRNAMNDGEPKQEGEACTTDKPVAPVSNTLQQPQGNTLEERPHMVNEPQRK